jgi:ATP-dependent 26S proteasome regulatory subunit
MDDQKAEKDKRVNAKEAAYRAKEEEREEAEREREELAKKEEEERKQKEQEEYEKWKEMFAVEDEGAANEGAANEYQGLLGLFVDYIKKNKVVVLEELASEFGLSATEAVERVELLEEMQRISGVVDDRGKFIYVTVDEMAKMAKFVLDKGRSNISDIVDECNSIVDLSPDSEKFTKDRDQVDLLSADDAGEYALGTPTPIILAHFCPSIRTRP